MLLVGKVVHWICGLLKGVVHHCQIRSIPLVCVCGSRSEAGEPHKDQYRITLMELFSSYFRLRKVSSVMTRRNMRMSGYKHLEGLSHEVAF
jgi:hypothetical protein